MCQREKILQYLKKYKKGLTQLESLNKFGCFRLASRIQELRELGHNIKTIRVKNNNKIFARYILTK